jgi:diguanylate cyclase (GGDEF)-like protein
VRSAALSTYVGFFCIAAVAFIYGRTRIVDLTATIVALSALWSVVNLIVAGLLFRRFYTSGRPAFGAIAAAYAISGLLILPYLSARVALSVAYQSIPDQQIAPSLFVVWQILFVVLVAGAIFYERIGHRVLPRALVPTAVYGSIGAAVVVAAIVAAATYFGRSHLPVFAIDHVVSTYGRDGRIVVIALNAVGLAALLFVRRRLGALYLSLGLAMWAAILDSALRETIANAQTYAFQVGTLMMLASSSVVMIVTIARLVRIFNSVSKLASIRSIRASSRMRSLWQIATSDGLSEANHMKMILDVATSEIRPGHDVFGLFGHLEGGSVRVDAASQSGDPNVLARAQGVYAAGKSLPIGSDIHAAVFMAGRTTYWHRPDMLQSALVASAGWSSIIATPIQLGNQTAFLVFGLPDSLEQDPFDESDVAFVEVIGSSIAHRYHQRAQLDRLQYHHEHDALTGAHNRKYYRILGRAAVANGSLLGAILLDLDGFGAINQRSGQMLADDLLVEIAASLDRVDDRDVVARLGGDEFGILLRCVDGDDATAFSQRVDSYARIFRLKFHTGDRDGAIVMKVVASIGASSMESASDSFDELFGRAEVAMYASKAGGGDCVTVFGPELAGAVAERSHERAEILSAIEADGFELDYQPIFDLRTRSMVAVEALIRWNNPMRGRLSPDEFLPAVRRAELMEELTSWVMRRVARDLKGVELPRTFRCYVNVTSSVLESQSFMLNLGQLLFANPDLSKHLGIELTETEAMHEVERAIDALKTVRGFGILVSIDDFGTGYSSLNYIKRLPLDALKLDKSFIAGLPDDAKDVGLAQLFFEMARRFSLQSVGEGIENEEQAAWLLANGCILGQGFLFASPMAWSNVVASMNEGVPESQDAAAASLDRIIFDAADGAVVRDGRAVEVSKGTLELLALLAVSRKPVVRETIVDTLWPDLDGDAAGNALKSCLYRSRIQLGDPSAITLRKGRYELGGRVVSTYSRILELPSSSRTTDLTVERREELRECYARLTRGGAADWATWTWFSPYRQRLAAAARGIGEILIADSAARSAFEDALYVARSLVDVDPLDESARVLVLRAHLAMGNRFAAQDELADFREARKLAGGPEPSVQLNTLAAGTVALI